MFDLDLCLSASVNVRYILHTQPLGLYNKDLVWDAEKSIKLTPSNRNELEYITEPVVIAKGAVSHVKLSPLDVSQGLKAPMVNKFSDVIFFEELSVMPTDRDIEFVIE
jgi:hypothetical protein